MLRILGVALALAAGTAVAAQERTVCTITVNSADEREVFRRHLPEGRFRFVELVERGRPDWLASACREKVSCDVLVVSGHFAGNEFYSSKFDVQESLPVDEMERVACSASCPDLFSALKEVYLFGCDSLKAEPVRSAAPEIVRGLVRAGTPRAEAERFARALSERHGEASRDRMRRIFADVPVIYGFQSLAPYGRVAGPMLRGHFERHSAEDVGTGRVSPRLVSLFAPASMVVASGQRAGDPHADYRAEACRFHDDAMTTGERLAFVHELLRRPMPEVRVAFDRIEKFVGSLDDVRRAEIGTAAALETLAADRPAREHFLGITRATEDPAIRVRMVSLARSLGWLTATEQSAELVHTIHDVLAAESMGFGEVDLVCTLNKDRSLDRALDRLQVRSARPAQAAALACLGNPDGHARMLKALASAHEGEVQIAQAYLRHRPITDTGELREVAFGIARMKGSGAQAQARALETLARLHVSDREILDELARLFSQSQSPQVQRAIAEVFLRAGSEALAVGNLAQTLRKHRVRASGGGEDLVEVLLRRLQGS